MCTVSFLPVNDRYFITSNRDEKYMRKPALPPHVFSVNGYQLLFPKDTDAGGSWIALNSNGNAAVLLNGGFVNHIPAASYRKSRGLVFLELIASRQPCQSFLLADLEQIQPFTLIIFSGGILYECRWDGLEKYKTVLSATEPHIWSSVTLYDAEVIAKRRSWFTEWLQQHPSPSQTEILHFHRFAGDGDPVNDLLMNRNNTLHTVSITGTEIGTDSGRMVYQDLLTGVDHTDKLSFTAQAVIV